jgi:hypothetical protein
VSASPEQIRKHLEILAKFEEDFGAMVRALEKYRGSGERTWSESEYQRRRRAILEDAARADRAIKASGVGYVAVRNPPLMGGGTVEDLPLLVFDYSSSGARRDSDGLGLQRRILQQIPAQLGGLRMKLEEAESEFHPDDPRSVVFGMGVSGSGAEEHTSTRVNHKKRSRGSRWEWLNHPWIVGIGVTVIGGGILALVIALIGGM